MFETVVPESVKPRSRALFYETLPVSVAIHVLIGVGILVAGVWEVSFPPHSPKLFMPYSLIEPPTPPPPAAPPPSARSVAQPAKTAPVKMPFVAPTVIPDAIPVVEKTDPAPAEELPAGPSSGDGVEGGVAGGVGGGEIGGVVGGVVGGFSEERPEIIVVKRDDPLPLISVSKEPPAYPETAYIRGWEDSLLVRYLIDKSGKVKEVVVLRPPQHEIFTRETLAAIRRWQFHPFIDDRGEAKEVSHELTVKFEIRRTARR